MKENRNQRNDLITNGDEGWTLSLALEALEQAQYEANHHREARDKELAELDEIKLRLHRARETLVDYTDKNKELLTATKKAYALFSSLLLSEPVKATVDLQSDVLRQLQAAIAKAEARSDKGEQCIYCGKNSWECEHYEEANQ